MLAQLFIRNIAVIEKASIDLEKGFTVLTGETGAGKSIIIDAIHAVLGERTSKELVRTGTDSASVSALFAGLDDDAALAGDPDGSWGEMMRKGVRVIQTDWPWQLSRYRARYFRKA